MALKAWLIHMPNRKHCEESADVVNSATSSEPNPVGQQQKRSFVVHRVSGVHADDKDNQT